MKPKNILVFILMLIIILPYGLCSAQASTFKVKVSDSLLNVRIVSTVNQNLTSFPTQKTSVIGTDLEMANRSLNNALREKLSFVFAKSLSITVDSKPQTMNVTAEFNIGGVVTQGDLLKINLAWKSFHVDDKLYAGNLSYNRLGQYFKTPMEDFIKLEANFFMNKSYPLTNEAALNTVSNLTLLNFKALTKPIQNWSKNYDPTYDRTTWKTEVKPQIDFTAHCRIQNKTLPRLFFLATELYAEIVAPKYAYAENDIISVDMGKGWMEPLMAVTIALAIGLGLAAICLERRRR